MSDAPAAPAAPAAAPAAAPTPADLAGQLAARGTENGLGIPSPGTPADLTPPSQQTPAPTATDTPAAPTMPDFTDPAAAQAAWEKAQAANAALRKENGDARINAKAAAAEEARKTLLADLTKVLDPAAAEGQAPTVEAVTEALSAQRFEAGTAQAAWQLGVDPAQSELLAFKLSRNADAKALDTSAPDFQAKLSAIVQAEIARDGSLAKAAVLPGPTSTQIVGGADGAGTITQDAFNAMSMAERGKLYSTDQAAYNRLAGNAS